MLSATQNILILTSDGDALGAALSANTGTVLRHAQLGHVVFHLGKDAGFLDLSTFDVILICTANLLNLPTEGARAIVDFVAKGGGLGVLYRSIHKELNALFGISPPQERVAYVGTAHAENGLHFPGRAFPAFAGLTLGETYMVGHASLDVWALRDVEIIATTLTGKPIVWRNSFGAGRVIYWNTGFLSEKFARGLIIETLQCLRPIAVLPLVNAGVLQVDDFPAPLSDDLHGAVAAEFPDLTGSQFYCTIWYPDLIGVAAKAAMPISLFCTFDYTNRTTPPFVPWRDTPLVAGLGDPSRDTFAAARALPPDEMGLHGFNHLSLVSDAWPDQATMQTSLEAAQTAWVEMGLGPLPTAYVPPNNEYDETGAGALHAACPTLRVISGNYIGAPNARGGNREFAPEPWQPALFCLPRATAGYECSQRTLFDAASQIAAFGIWTHFLHADDVCDTPEHSAVKGVPRNPRNLAWRGRFGTPGLLKELARLLDTVQRRFPWLRGMTTTAAADRLATFLETPWTACVQGTQLRIAGVHGSHFQVRLNGSPRPRIKKCEGARILHRTSASDYCMYVIVQDADAVKIEISHRTRAGDLKNRLRRLVST
jgi:hypothetical protein